MLRKLDERVKNKFLGSSDVRKQEVLPPRVTHRPCSNSSGLPAGLLAPKPQRSPRAAVLVFVLRSRDLSPSSSGFVARRVKKTELRRFP